jgi:hypothetical protein
MHRRGVLQPITRRLYAFWPFGNVNARRGFFAAWSCRFTEYKEFAEPACRFDAKQASGQTAGGGVTSRR